MFIFSNKTYQNIPKNSHQNDLIKTYQMIYTIYYELLNKEKIFIGNFIDTRKNVFNEDKFTKLNNMLLIFSGIFIGTRKLFNYDFVVYDHITLENIYKQPFINNLYKVSIEMNYKFFQILIEKFNDAKYINLKEKSIIKNESSSKNEVLNKSEILFINYIYKIVLQTHLFNTFCGKDYSMSSENIYNLKISLEASKYELPMFLKKFTGDFNEKNIETFKSNIEEVCKTANCKDYKFFYFYNLYEMLSDINEKKNEITLLAEIKTKYFNIRENIVELIKKLDKKYIENRNVCINIMFYLNLGIIEINHVEKTIANLKTEIEKFNLEIFDKPDLAIEYEFKIISSFKVDVLDIADINEIKLFSFFQNQNNDTIFIKKELNEAQLFLENWKKEFDYEIKKELSVQEELKHKEIKQKENLQKENEQKKKCEINFAVKNGS
ncbi:hypothetical protein GVAV_001616 [Gurleya vavrai]